ncbi:MAG TPA: hypothetical protein DEO82_07035 [Eubacterium sp.]|nr:hypothetical protein [Eubacterium sp.]
MSEVKKAALKTKAVEAVATDVKEVKAEAVEAAKTEVKAAKKETKKVVKTEAKTEAKAAKTTKTAAKKTVKADEKKETNTAKVAAKTEVVIQYNGEENNFDEIASRAKSAWAAETGKKVTDMKECKIYIKPQDRRAYYVIDGYTGSVDLF